MPIRTTLIYPGIAGRGFNSLKQGMDAGWISHGLASLSAAAKAHGFEVDLIDLRALSSWDHFREVLAERDPDVVGLTMMSVDYNPARQAIAIAKEVKPEVITIIGGAHVTIALEDSLRIPHVDYLITREGEVTFPHLLSLIEGGDPPPNRVLRGATPDLDAIPFADRGLFLDEWRKWGYDLDSPEVPFVKELPPPFVTIIAGRGCIYNCAFCKPGEDYLFGKRTRRRSANNVIAELRMLVDRYQIASFMFHDDCLTEDREWVSEFTDKYIAEGFTMPFFCQSRADIIVKHEGRTAWLLHRLREWQRPRAQVYPQGNDGTTESPGRPYLPQVWHRRLGQLHDGIANRDQRGSHGHGAHDEEDRPRLLQPSLLHPPPRHRSV
jgi:anaerobic magnesium-protoporphyrin IX monomethyl ester cyclase